VGAPRSDAPAIEQSLAQRLDRHKNRKRADPGRGKQPSASVFHALDLELQAFAQVAAVSLPGGQKLARFFRGFRLDAPFFRPRDQHRGVKRPQRWGGLLFECGDGHSALFLGESGVASSLAVWLSVNKSTTQPQIPRPRVFHPGFGTDPLYIR